MQPVYANTSSPAFTPVAKGTPPAAYPKGSATTAQPTADVVDVLRQKLENCDLKLQSAQSIALLNHCIGLGKIEAAKANKENVTVFIGNTGAGKSTFVNYLCGRKMMRVLPKSIGLKGTEKVVVVKSVAQGGPFDEIMKIGHENVSKTFMPELAKHEGHTFCDCPGFIDNRGYEVNIANAVNMRRTFGEAATIKVVIMINHHSLKADRARGLKDMINICCSLFGSKENLLKYKNSVLLCVTQTPFKEVADEGEEQEVLTVDDLRSWMASEKGLNDFDKSVLKELSDNLIIYDPCDSKNLKYQGALTRPEILQAIDNLEPITKPLDIFKTVLTPTDMEGLISIAQEIKASIQALFAKQGLSSEDFAKIASYQDSLNQLEVIEHPYVARLTTETRNVISEYFQGLVHQFELKCVDTSADLSAQSAAILKIIKEGIQHFDQQIQSQINTKALDARYEALILKQAARKEILRLADLEKDFRTCCAYDQFDKAKELLKQIEKALTNFATAYGSSGEKPTITLDELKKLYQTTKDAYDKSVEKQKAQRQKLAELEQKLDQERKEREREAKLQEERLAKEKRDAEAAFKKMQEESALKAKKELELQANKEKQAVIQTKTVLTQKPQTQHHPQMNFCSNKKALRDQILGPGPANIMATPMGPQLVTYYGQCHPIVWMAPGGFQVVINTVAGFFLLDQEGATPVFMTPNGPMPR